MGSTFTDNTNYNWDIHITTAGVERVKAHVIGVNGQPVDLFAIAEAGDFSAISGRLQIVLQVVFWLCLDEILQNFDLENWDKTHTSTYALIPDEQKKTTLQKAADWFGERIGGKELQEMTEAWETAIINFIPNARIRQGIENVLAKEKEYNFAMIEVFEKRRLKEIQDRQKEQPET